MPAPSHAPAWWTDAVVYQVYPRSFQDSDGDGIGDLRGILSRVDHLAELGIDVVWLSPVYRSPQNDNGYDISDYRDIDPLFGTMADLDALIAALHERGIRIIMDLVVNHTSDEHPWFVESRAGRDSARRDWYWWRPPRPGIEPGTAGAEPTNWASAFTGPAWEFDADSGEYYLHLFSRKQPDLNWENPEVRHAVYDMMRWWLDRGIDGFRMDVINLVSKPLGPDGMLHDGPVARGTLAEGEALSANGPRLHEYLQEMNREVFAGRRERLLLVGETPGATVEDGLLFTDPRRHELDMVFTFEHVSLDHGPGGRYDRRPLKLQDLKAVMNRWQTGLAEHGWNSLYWDNHDQPRAVSRFGDDGRWWWQSATMLATVLHLHRGTPFVYQGEELGMTNAHFTSLRQYRDISALRFAAHQRAFDLMDEPHILAALEFGSRDNARTPVQWDASPNAGFTTGTPWIDVNPNHARINATRQREDDASVYRFHRRLIRLRHEDETVRLGAFSMLLPDDPFVYAFTRRRGGDCLLVLCNFSGQDQDRVLGELASGGGSLVIGNYSDRTSPPARHVTLRPWEALVVRLPAPA